MDKFVTEELQIVPAFVPVSLVTGANTGDWVSMKGYDRCSIVFLGGAGVAGDDPVLTVQATDVSGTDPKALKFDRVDVKQNATIANVGTFTTVMQSAAETYTDATSAEVQKMWVIDIKSDDLDVNNGYVCVQGSVAQTTSAAVGGALYILRDSRYNNDGVLPAATTD